MAPCSVPSFPGELVAWQVPHKNDPQEKPCLVITNLPKGLSAAKVKRLLEIAAMDEAVLVDQIAKAIHKANIEADCCYGECAMTKKDFTEAWDLLEYEEHLAYRHKARTALKSLGLTPPARRKDGKK